MYRLYSEESLQPRSKLPKRHISAARRQPRPAAQVKNTNEAWSIDFVSDQLQGGQNFRILYVFNAHTRQCLAALPVPLLRGEHVVSELDVIRWREGAPERIYFESGRDSLDDLLIYRRITTRSSWPFHGRKSRRKMHSLNRTTRRSGTSA